MNTMKRAAWIVLLTVLTAPAWAAGKAADGVRKQVEMSMVLTGKVRIADDGSVRGLQIDRESEVPSAVAELVRGDVSRWKFDPVHAGEALADEATSMTVRVVARAASDQGDGKYAVHIVS